MLCDVVKWTKRLKISKSKRFFKYCSFKMTNVRYISISRWETIHGLIIDEGFEKRWIPGVVSESNIALR